MEEKNGSIVRKLIGYERYESMESWEVLTQLYSIARLYINFFQPCVKLISKERDGGRVRKKYDKAKTPCERILESPLVAEEQKDQLRDLFRSLDPLLLLQEIERYQVELRKYAANGNAQRAVDNQHCELAATGGPTVDVKVVHSDLSPAVDAPTTGKRKKSKAVRATPKASKLPDPIDQPMESERGPGVGVPDMIYEPGPMHPKSLSTLIEKFVNDHLRKQRRSGNTIAAYNDSLRLLHQFAQRHLNKDATTLKIADLTVSLVQAFLDDMEQRGVSTSSRNLRLTVIHCFCRYIRAEVTSVPPSLSAVLKLRGDKYTRPTIDFLTTQEIGAILAAPDRSTWTARRDHAFLTIALETGLLVSELIKLTRKNVKRLETGVHICVADKGRSQRFIPLTQQSVDVLDSWMQESKHRNAQTLFPNARGGGLTDDAVRYILNMQIGTACESCPSLEEKRVTPFILRHTRALQLLQSGLERDKLVYWLGLNSAGSIQTYIDADIALRKKALKEQRNISS